MKKIVRFKAKTHSYLTHGGSEDIKAKDTKKCAIVRKLKLQDYKIV